MVRKLFAKNKNIFQKIDRNFLRIQFKASLNIFFEFFKATYYCLKFIEQLILLLKAIIQKF